MGVGRRVPEAEAVMTKREKYALRRLARERQAARDRRAYWKVMAVALAIAAAVVLSEVVRETGRAGCSAGVARASEYLPG